jgi:hypothetical protein
MNSKESFYKERMKELLIVLVLSVSVIAGCGTAATDRVESVKRFGAAQVGTTAAYSQFHSTLEPSRNSIS